MRLQTQVAPEIQAINLCLSFFMRKLRRKEHMKQKLKRWILAR